MSNKQILIFSLLAALLVAGIVSNRPQATADRLLSPVPEVTASPIPSPVATPSPRKTTDEEMMLALPYGEVVWATYGHESGWGKHDSCRAKGKYNGFGYGMKNGSYPCFDSLEEIAGKVSAWFTKNLDSLTIRQALCKYNSGVAEINCDYASYTMQMMGGAK